MFSYLYLHLRLFIVAFINNIKEKTNGLVGLKHRRGDQPKEKEKRKQMDKKGYKHGQGAI